MEKCPKCGCYMNLNMTYFCGSPIFYYVCPQCQFDTRNYKVVATTSTIYYYPKDMEEQEE